MTGIRVEVVVASGSERRVLRYVACGDVWESDEAFPCILAEGHRTEGFHQGGNRYDSHCDQNGETW